MSYLFMYCFTLKLYIDICLHVYVYYIEFIFMLLFISPTYVIYVVLIFMWSFLSFVSCFGFSFQGKMSRMWIIYNKPEEPNAIHAGLILALGLHGYLRVLTITDIYQYLYQVLYCTTFSSLLSSFSMSFSSLNCCLPAFVTSWLKPA